MIADSPPRSLSVRILLPRPGSCLDTLAFSANLLMESLEQTWAGTFTGLMALLTFLAFALRLSHELHEMRVTGRMIPWVEIDPSDRNKQGMVCSTSPQWRVFLTSRLALPRSPETS